MENYRELVAQLEAENQVEVEEALRALSKAPKYRKKDLIVRLQRFLEHNNAHVRRTAVITLGLLKNPKTIPVLKSFLQDADSSVQNAAIRALGLLEKRCPVSLVKLLIKRWYNTEDERELKAIGEALCRIGHHFAIGPLLKHYPSIPESVQSILVKELLNFNEDRIYEFYLAKLRDERDAIRLQAVKAVGILRLPDGISGILELLDTEENPEIIQELITAAGKLGLAEAIPTIENYCDIDEGEDLRLECFTALKNIATGEVVPLAKSFIYDESPEIREEIVHVLSAVGSESACKLLEEIATGKTDEDETSIIELAKEAHQKVEKELQNKEEHLKLGEELGNPQYHLRERAVRRLASLNQPPLDALIQAASNGDGKDNELKRAYACETLGLIGNLTTIPVLRKAYVDGNRTTRAFAGWALKKLRVLKLPNSTNI